MSHLLLWSCGPVQDFIASARKGRDLWFGSWLLSELSTAAAVALLDAGARLIMPAAKDRATLQRPDFDVPNKVLAQVEHADLAALGAGTTEAARARLLQIASETFALPGVEGLVDTSSARAQVADLLETYWAAVLCTDDFRADRFRVEALLAARKSARMFQAPTFAAAGVPKSSLDGQREAVTRRGAGLRLSLNHDERLCGVGLVKRLGHRVAGDDAPGGRVASVSAFALATWLRPALGDPPSTANAQVLRELVGTFADSLTDAGLTNVRTPSRAGPILGTVNAHAFYASRLHELTDGDERRSGVDEAARVYSGALGQFRAAVASRCNVRLSSGPTPYYAALIADGDHMGRFLDALDERGVAAVSRQLSAFAEKVRAEVFAEGSLELPHTLLGGQCVYAGGDDVLALVPVDRALSIARSLRDTFAAAMQALDPDIRALAIGRDRPLPTLSVGIAVGHHLVPLRDVLDGARAAERVAKEDAGRNAWAVRILKRSGAPLDAYGRWDDGSSNRLQGLQEGFGPAAARRLPHGLPYVLRDTAHRIHRGSRGSTPEANAVEVSELVRVLRQKHLMSEAPAMRAEVERRGLDDLADSMLVARALAGFGGAA